MNYYNHHIGDYLVDTAHLSILEDGAYRRLMDRYYTTEQPIPADEAALFRVLRARSEDEKEAVRVVLSEFFTLTGNAWSHKRCDSEIESYQAKAEANRSNGAKGGRPPKAKEQALDNPQITQVVSENNPQITLTNNQEPITNNQEPITNNQKPKEHTPQAADAYSQEFESAWSSYPQRPGANKRKAFKAWTARLKAGVDVAGMTLGVDRYAHYVAVMRTEPQFIKQPETFFGPDEHFRSSWEVTPPTRASPIAKQSRHSGFDEINYSEGVTADGRIE